MAVESVGKGDSNSWTKQKEQFEKNVLNKHVFSYYKVRLEEKCSTDAEESKRYFVHRGNNNTAANKSIIAGFVSRGNNGKRTILAYDAKFKSCCTIL